MRKSIVIAATLCLLSTVAMAEDKGWPEPQGFTQQQETVATCNVQIGQAILNLGQTQEEVIALRKQVSDLQKQLAEKTEENSRGKISPKN